VDGASFRGLKMLFFTREGLERDFFKERRAFLDSIEGGSRGGNAKATFGTLAVALGRDLFSSKRILPKALRPFLTVSKSTLERGFTPRKGPKSGIAQQLLAGPLL